MYFKRLYDLRNDHDLTQQNVADYLTCNRQVYARYERGLREIPVSMLIKLADLYETSVDYILERTDDISKLWQNSSKAVGTMASFLPKTSKAVATATTFLYAFI